MTLTDKDIERLMAVFPTKDDVRKIVKEETAPLQESVRDLVQSIDGLVKQYSDLNREYAAMKAQLDRQKRWIEEIAEQLRMTLKD